MPNVVPFPHPAAPTSTIGHFIRLGESGYQRLANQHAAGRLPANRVVVDASRLRHQKELVSSLRSRGCEIVLDSKAAELSALEKYQGYARNAPWSSLNSGRPLTKDNFVSSSPDDIFGQIARFAIEHGVDAVLAPTHFLGDPSFNGWFAVDRASCIALRKALDREGGAAIAIDYLLIPANTTLNEDSARSEFLSGLDGLPFDNLWIRSSGFGNDAGPLTTRRFIAAMSSLHNLGKPIVADYLGGLVGHSLLAFGAVSGVCHGIGERERFDARSWHKPAVKKEGDKFGRATRILISGLDRSATIPELQLMANARGGRKLVTCCNRACCPHGMSDTIADPRQHAAFQCFSAIADLSNVPDLNREQHFLNGRMAEVDRQCRQVKELKFSTDEAARHKIDIENLTKRLQDHSLQVEKIRLTLEDLHETRASGAPRARPLQSRARPTNRNEGLQGA